MSRLRDHFTVALFTMALLAFAGLVLATLLMPIALRLLR